MADVCHVYEDGWGEIIDRPTHDLVELRWFDTTQTMSADEFKAWLETFASHVEQLRRSSVLVDATRFGMDPARMDDEWRGAYNIPRYHRAGGGRVSFPLPPRGPPPRPGPRPPGASPFPPP